MASTVLQNLAGGINRMRERAGVRADQFYDVVNMYPTTARRLRRRPGFTLVAALEAGTKGLVGANGVLNTFYSTGTIVHANNLFLANKVPHPTNTLRTVSVVHYGKLFLGALYVVIEYDDASVFHHYLKAEDTWTANTKKNFGDRVQPTVPNGFVYEVVSVANDPQWTADTVYAVNDFVQPTTANGFRYQLTAAVPAGSVIRSSDTEPTWPTVAGQTVDEIRDITRRKIPKVVANLRTEIRNDLARESHSMWRGGMVAHPGAMILPRNLPGWYGKGVHLTPARTGNAEPNWPVIEGNTVVDGGVTWEMHKLVTLTWTAVAINQSAGVEPAWPTVPGNTIVDGTITWKCVARVVTDPNCPQTKSVAIAHSKVYAIDGDAVDYCATQDPMDWTSANDAGFLPTGLQATGDQATTALALYRGNLVVFSAEGAQIWQVDEDPANSLLVDTVDGAGTTLARAAASLIGDLLFTSPSGIRSVSVSASTGDMAGGDVGTRVDDLVVPALAGVTPLAIYVPGLGQWWLICGAEAFVYTYSKVAKITAWTRYTFPWSIDAATTLDGALYVRSGDNVYQLDAAVHADNGVVYDAIALWGYLDLEAPGLEKLVQGVDVIATAACNVSVGYDESDDTAFTAEELIGPDVRVGGFAPIQVAAPSLAPKIRHSVNEAFELQTVELYYEPLRATG